MRSKIVRLFALFVVLSMFLTPLNTSQALAVVAPTANGPTTPTSQSISVTNKSVRGGVSDTGLYIVQLNAPSLAAYQGGIDNLAATSTEATGTRRLDVNTPASQAYLNYLDAQQSSFIKQMDSALGRSVSVVYQYKNVLNALSVKVGLDEANKLLGLGGVRAIYADKLYNLDTDVGPEWIGAPFIWDGDTGSGVATKGEGVIVGMIDSGINHAHPSFADVGGDGYNTTNPFGSGNYFGYCLTHPSFCNDKLIGAYDLYPGGSGGPEDTLGHGSHTASTAAGNQVEAVFMVGSQTITRTISGVAPHANIISYKVCLNASSCDSSASIQAVELAIPEQVNVLNYSISGSDDPWNDPVDQAFLEATVAGIFVATSAGNDGPGPSTVAHTGPWEVATGAATHPRIFADEFDVTGPGIVPSELTGLAALQGTGPALTTDISDTITYDPANLEGCDAFSAGFFTSKLALIQRGSCSFAAKVANATDAGADGVLVFNNLGGPPIIMGGLDGTTIPSAMLSMEDGLAVQAWIDANPSTSTGTLYAAVDAVINPAFADIMASFSSRGPSQFDVLKPDFVAPGVNILAAVQAQNGDPVQYALYQGTSMASPHAAGSGALMIALHPDWSPQEIKSALASSAFNGPSLRKEDGVTPANPNDAGSGRLALGDAATVGLVWNETYADFVAADPDTGGSPKTLNLSTMTDHQCIGSCSWNRTVTSVLDITATYTATFSSTTGIVGSVTPMTFTIPAGGTQMLTVTADVSSLPEGTWVFGNVMLDTDATFPPPPPLGKLLVLPVAEQHMTLSVLPAASNLPDLVTIATEQKAGSQAVTDLLAGQDITDLTTVVDGLDKATVYQQNVPEDPTPGDPFNGDGGTITATMQVVTGTMRLVAQIMQSTSMDVDLYVGLGTTPSSNTLVCVSATSAVLEYCNLNNPAPGTYWVLAQNYQGSSADLISLAVGAVVPGDMGNLTVTGPATVSAGTPFDLSVNWNDPSLMDGEVYYGVFSLGTDSGNPDNLGSTRVDFNYTQPVYLSKQGPMTAVTGDVISYTLTLTGPSSLNAQAWLTDTLPTGVEFAGGLTSTFGTANYDMGTNSVYWNDAVAMHRPSAVLYDQTTHQSTNAFASQQFENSNAPFDNQSADDFVVSDPQGWTIDGVHAPGAYAGPGPTPFVNVFFYEDNSGLPGTEVYSATGIVPGGAVSGDLIAMLATPVYLPPGTYWVSVQADMDYSSGGQWYWFNSSELTNSSFVWRNPGDGFGSGCTSWTTASSCGGTDPDLSYQLMGVVGIPAPQTIDVTFNVTVTATAGTSITNTVDLNYNGDMFTADSTLTVVKQIFTNYLPVLLDQAIPSDQ